MKGHLYLLLTICIMSLLVLALRSSAQAQPVSQPSASRFESARGEAYGLSRLSNESQLIRMARPTWDTGWFQAEIYKQLLQELGYTVKGPKTMEAEAFYLSAAQGEIDLWVNGWFPSSNFYLENEEVQGKVEVVGTSVKGGAVQGYLIDKKSAEEFGITSLADLADPEIAKRFDVDNDGLADLIGCNASWRCSENIEHHLDAYGVRDTVEQVQGDYSPLMANTVVRHKRGEPILFYSWTPNWTIGTLRLGEEVVWIEVPFASFPEGEAYTEEEITIPDLPGCVSNPCKVGFAPSDIRGVANKAFLEQNPAVRVLLEAVEIPLGDINQQNARMIDGEGHNQDIRRHAQEWIKKNRQQVEEWLEAVPEIEIDPASAAEVLTAEERTLRVVTKRVEPFVIYQEERYTGFSIELWEKIAQEVDADPSIDIEYEIYAVDTVAKLLDEVERGAADVATAEISITSEREQTLDFSHPFFESGLQIMVQQQTDSVLGAIIGGVLSIIFSPQLLYVCGVFVLMLLVAAHLIWFFERRHNSEFPSTYFEGIWEGLWWAIVTVTTVGYGDKTPQSVIGRLLGMIWILAGYFIFAYFTASVASTITLQELQGTINGPEDLPGKMVATVEKSVAAEYLSKLNVRTFKVDDIQDAYQALEQGKVDAVLYDSPVLQYYARNQGQGKVYVVGPVFQPQSYGIALQEDSPYQEEINFALLKLIENGTYKEIYEKWFGEETE